MSSACAFSYKVGVALADAVFSSQHNVCESSTGTASGSGTSSTPGTRLDWRTAGVPPSQIQKKALASRGPVALMLGTSASYSVTPAMPARALTLFVFSINLGMAHGYDARHLHGGRPEREPSLPAPYAALPGDSARGRWSHTLARSRRLAMQDSFPAPTCSGNLSGSSRSCASYNCTMVGKGHYGKVCNCGAYLRKIAHPGCECSLGDELNSMALLAGTHCVGQQYVDEGAGCPQKALLRNVGDGGGPTPVTAAQTVCIHKVRGNHAATCMTGKHHTDQLCTNASWQSLVNSTRGDADATRIACQRADKLFQSLPARGVDFHDDAISNFFFAALTGGADVPPCPVHIIDLPQYEWACGSRRPKRRFSTWSHNWEVAKKILGCSKLQEMSVLDSTTQGGRVGM